MAVAQFTSVEDACVILLVRHTVIMNLPCTSVDDAYHAVSKVSVHDRY